MPKDDIHRLALHAAISTLGAALSYAFSAVFLIHVGLAPAQVFLAFAAILVLRFVMRPLVLVAVPAVGLRRAFIFGSAVGALSCPVLALVDGVGPALGAYLLLSALGQVFYCTCYHVFFSGLGDTGRRGSQIGLFQALGALAACLGPGIGGVLLTFFGPWATFGTAFVVGLAAIVPIIGIAEPPLTRAPPKGAYAAARIGAWLYFTDGWMQVSLLTAWSIVMFQALGNRYDSFGGTLSLAALAGAIGGMLFGRFIDRGHGRKAVWINAAILAGGLVLRSLAVGHAAAVVAVAVGATLLSGLYLPSWMTPAYNAAKSSPCMLRFQFAAEAGWDIGGALAGVIAALICFLKLPLAAAILLALPMVLLQALLLDRSYALRFAAAENGALATTS